ncbi:MAG TPA: hypothetical protein VGM69_08530, partial [Chloroflexota bacterium]
MVRVPWRGGFPTAAPAGALRPPSPDHAASPAEGGPFADLPPSPATHFRRWFYGAVLHVLNRVFQA